MRVPPWLTIPTLATVVLAVHVAAGTMQSGGNAMPPTTDPEVLAMRLEFTGPNDAFAANAFPPTMPESEWHAEAWMTNTCLRCHETGVESAPIVKHYGLPEIFLVAKCRSCHVVEPGLMPTGERDNTIDDRFASNAFPPMMPNSTSHVNAWTTPHCMLCHEDGVKGAPIVKHEGLPGIYIDSKCRSCHVQIRGHQNDPWGAP
ncbi:MAG: hypothetical protein GY715_01155 [Planctomycetes bacterium]|nr:hypothetical protein [Planctomycetota bacterium]